MPPRRPGPATELEELRARLEDAERSSEEKTRFIRHVSHEFRTPLSSIIGFGALLQREGEALDPAVRAEYLEIVLRNARHLLHVVNDLLNISKVEAGKLEVTLAPVRVPEVAAAVVTALGPAAEERDIRLRLEDGGAPPALADSGRLRQVLFNLLENAIKYSPPGAEVVVCSRAAEGGVRVEVEDRGPGISRRDQARLFKEFSRVNPPGIAGGGRGAGAGAVADAGGGDGRADRGGVDAGAGEHLLDRAPRRGGARRRGAGARACRRRRASGRRRWGSWTTTRTCAPTRPRCWSTPATARRWTMARRAPAARLAEARPAIILLDMNLAGRTGVGGAGRAARHPGAGRRPRAGVHGRRRRPIRRWRASRGA